jgi:hypothetical protein
VWTEHEIDTWVAQRPVVHASDLRRRVTAKLAAERRAHANLAEEAGEAAAVHKDCGDGHGHDALEFPDGQVILLTTLREGQHATVPQLPASATRSEAEAEARASINNEWRYRNRLLAETTEDGRGA